jgi:hypothetical protein
MENDKPNYWGILPANVRYADIPAAAKLFYSELTALTSREGYCWAPNSYFAELYGVDAYTVTRWVTALENLGAIRTEVDQAAGNKRKIWLTTDKFGGTLPTKMWVATHKNVGSSINNKKNKGFVGQNGFSIQSPASNPPQSQDSEVEVDGEGMPVKPPAPRQAAQEDRGEAFGVLSKVSVIFVKEIGVEPILGDVALKAIKRALKYIKAEDVLLMVGDAVANGYAEKVGLSLAHILSDARINKFRIDNQ